MELAEPRTILSLAQKLCRSCYTWEDADQLAMRAVEPIVRKEPDIWLSEIEPWLVDDNKWVRRSGVTVVGRLPMKQPAYTARCLELTERMLLDEQEVVRKATSFAIRISARGDLDVVRDFLASQVPPADPRATWVLCDAIRSMTRSMLPEISTLLPNYERWLASETLSPRDRRSVESAVRVLEQSVGPKPGN
jgi:hypothetical protein